MLRSQRAVRMVERGRGGSVDKTALAIPLAPDAQNGDAVMGEFLQPAFPRFGAGVEVWVVDGVEETDADITEWLFVQQKARALKRKFGGVCERRGQQKREQE